MQPLTIHHLHRRGPVRCLDKGQHDIGFVVQCEVDNTFVSLTSFNTFVSLSSFVKGRVCKTQADARRHQLFINYNFLNSVTSSRNTI